MTKYPTMLVAAAAIAAVAVGAVLYAASVIAGAAVNVLQIFERAL